MPLHTTDALILRTYKLGESDRIVVFLTRDRGKKRGVAKNARQSAELLRRTSELVSASAAPVLIGASRKSFLKHLHGDEAEPKDRVGASLVAALYAVKHGAKMVRVHDVRATRQAVDAAVALDPHFLLGSPKPIDTERSLEDANTGEDHA